MTQSFSRRAAGAAALAVFLTAALAVVHAYERPRLDAGAFGDVLDPDQLSVDLHAHLFMKPGLSFFFNGDFFGPLKASGWKSRFSNQINAEAVERSGIGILVVALYANPIFTWTPREAVREEIRQAERFVAEHPQWMIARDPAEARRALARGQRVLVLSLERASWVLETEADLREFIDEKGIRIVTPLHLTDDTYGGVAFLRGYHQLSTPLRWFIELFHPHFETDGTKVNPRGLTARGEALARKLIARGVWLDLSHASDASQRELAQLMEQAGQPLLYTHTGLRRFGRVERALSDEQLAEVARTGGIVGICPSEDTLDPTDTPPELCKPGCPGPCGWGLPAFVAQYEAAAHELGPENVFIGSDFNGAIPHLHPSCGTGTELDREGYWNIGQTGSLWEAARRLGAPVPARLSAQLDSFLTKWERAVRSRTVR